MKRTDEQNYGAIQVFSVHHREVSRSTNLEAIELAEQGFPEGTVIVADTQTSGSGRRGRKWASPKGKEIEHIQSVQRYETDRRTKLWSYTGFFCASS